MQIVRVATDTAEIDSVFIVHTPQGLSRTPWVENRVVHYELNTPQRVSLQSYDRDIGRFISLEESFRSPGTYEYKFADTIAPNGKLVFRLATDSMSVVFQASGDSICNIFPWQQLTGNREAWVSTVAERLTMDEWEPIEKRIRPATLDSVLGSTLAAAGIALTYAFGVISSATDSLKMTQPAGYAEELRQSEYRARLFPGDIFAPRHDLAVYFPGHRGYLWRQMGPLFAATFLLMLVIIICFILAVRTIITQRQLADRMVGFINNMTHEFKTPISTVALACQAIARPDILDQKDKIARYNRMIKDENRRMQGQVEKILQMAVLEKGDYELQLAEVDVHEVIKQTVDSITLQVEHRGGRISTALNAARHVVHADVVHLANIFNNLLDNANKYSPQSPVISVATANDADSMVITITDQGMGIKAEDRKMVFDKYYRVPAGNIHDVKGFGLGLSYVKLMVMAHGGTISLAGPSGGGTRVDIRLPLADGEHHE
jgi:two-component system phosphate regulon sensor histidine kinase PhoR